MTTARARTTVLILMSDTGGGHRRAAEAVIAALADRYPGRFRAVLCDPLAGAGSARSLRWLARLYGPLIRLAPWLWGAAYYLSNSRAVMAVLWRTVFALAGRPVLRTAAAVRPDVIVSCHPLTGRAAWRAAAVSPGTAVVTVVTDLVSVHASWRHPGADRVAVATAQAGAVMQAALPAATCTHTGLPVNAGPGGRPAASRRGALRRALGLPESGFVILLTGGGEGCGRLGQRAKAILAALPEAHVVTVCGRNERLLLRLRRQRASGAVPSDRLTVLGFADSMPDWLASADVVVTKAGPGVLAEAACCGTPVLVTSHLPGQERGNGELVTQAGAGRRVRGTRHLLRTLTELSGDAAALALMQAGCAALARPDAAASVADLIADRCGQQHGPGGPRIAPGRPLLVPIRPPAQATTVRAGR